MAHALDVPHPFVGLAGGQAVLDDLGDDQDLAPAQRGRRRRLGGCAPAILGKLALVLDVLQVFLEEAGVVDVADDALEERQGRREQRRQVIVGRCVASAIKVVDVRRGRACPRPRWQTASAATDSASPRRSAKAVVGGLFLVGGHREPSREHRPIRDIGIQRRVHQIAHLGSRAGVVVDGLLVNQSLHIGAQALDQGRIDQAIAVGNAIGIGASQVVFPDCADAWRLAHPEPALWLDLMLGPALAVAQHQRFISALDDGGLPRRKRLARFGSDVVGIELDQVAGLRR